MERKRRPKQHAGRIVTPTILNNGDVATGDDDNDDDSLSLSSLTLLYTRSLLLSSIKHLSGSLCYSKVPLLDGFSLFFFKSSASSPSPSYFTPPPSFSLRASALIQTYIYLYHLSPPLYMFVGVLK